MRIDCLSARLALIRQNDIVVRIRTVLLSPAMQSRNLNASIQVLRAQTLNVLICVTSFLEHLAWFSREEDSKLWQRRRRLIAGCCIVFVAKEVGCCDGASR